MSKKRIAEREERANVTLRQQTNTYYRGQGDSGLDRHLTAVSQRISPLVDTSHVEAFGVTLHDSILGIEMMLDDAKSVTNEEQRQRKKRSIMGQLCKLGVMVYNKIGLEPLPNTRFGGKRNRKTRRRMRGKRKGKTRRKRKR